MFEVTRALTIPFFLIALLFVTAEIFISKKKGLSLYQAKDSVCNFLILVIARLSQPLFLGYIYAAFKMMEGYRFFTIPDNAATTLLAFALTDFIYYWEHRASHTIQVLWFFHEVHHSSRNFNLTTSFRLHWLNRLTAPLIFAPLVLFGFKAEQVVLFFTINLFYQFFLHTQTVGKLGVAEGILNTPSAHRVHHGRNDIYIDKNFGGVLMIWDRLFNTYQAETEVPQYGILGDFESHNPVTVQFHNLPGYSHMATKFLSIKRLSLVIPFVFALVMSGLNAQTAAARDENVQVKKPIEGHVDFQDEPQQNLMQGLWKANIKEFARHPTVAIESQNGNQLQGTYKGLIGKFPLTGLFDEKTGAVQLYVDFTRSRFFNPRGARQMVAVLDGTLSGNTITGTACIPEFGERRVHFEATRREGRNELQ